MKSIFSGVVIATTILLFTFGTSCKKNSPSIHVGKDITTAPHAYVDRFSSAFGHIFVRTATNGLPAANAPINMDVVPFITHGLNPDGTPTTYYNFDVLPVTPVPIYVFFKQSAPTVELTAQNHVIPVKPGDAGYNDFWLVNKVMVPDNYVPNSLTNATAILNSGYPIVATNQIVNCPVVPFGSTAALTYGSTSPQSLVTGWYKDSTVVYFNFDEAKTPLTLTSANQVPTPPIYVLFANNTDPSMGFATVTGSTQTHNVISVNPTQTG
jgi:hypothetical protein